MRRVRIHVRGVVQGVGFRPFVWRLARGHGLSGWVKNDPGGVEIEAGGPPSEIEAFIAGISREAPPLARVTGVEVADAPDTAAALGFRILPSTGGSAEGAVIPPDTAACPECLRELSDPRDRRFRHPFISCTQCGPRYTIVSGLPYDRAKTTMAAFPMCPACRAEYENPADRRFHAEPVACPECGPRVWLETPEGAVRAVGDAAIREAVSHLCGGRVVAVKGLGGFHLACDAALEPSVRRLRLGKCREEKPFAVMFRDMEALVPHALVTEEERAALLSPERPIVLLSGRAGAPPLAASVAPGSRLLGAFLPYAPLQHLLFSGAPYHALVMTSGNPSGEPLCAENEEARARLSDLADAFLVHDRGIRSRCDDSVARVALGAPRLLRRARGYVPRALPFPGGAPCILATGARQKNTVCLTLGAEAHMSPHVGDLDTVESLRAFEDAVERLESHLGARPALIAHDLHPDCPGRRYATSRKGVATLPVQHHHAHIAAVACEHGLSGPLLGVACDGAGYGPDGTVWGGEVLWCEGARYRRLGHLRHLRLPGGDRAAREPFRMAVAALHALSPPEGGEALARLSALRGWPGRETALLCAMIEKGVNAPLTSSCGRLFDAVAAIAGVRNRCSFEGQAAMELEQAAEDVHAPYDFAVTEAAGGMLLDTLPIVAGAAADAFSGVPASVIAGRFHETLALLFAEAAESAARETGATRVALSGGVFQNARLLSRLHGELSRRGLAVFVPERVPANDGGLSLGQAFVAAHALKEGSVNAP